MQDEANIRTNAAGEICSRLQTALSSVAVETATLQAFHYNVTGMSFVGLHNLFEDMYRDHFDAQDTLAERMRALGTPVENRLSKHLDHTEVPEHESAMGPRDMVEALVADQERLGRTLKEIAVFADEHGDIVTHDMLVARAEVHDKNAWMLRAHLD